MDQRKRHTHYPCWPYPAPDPPGRTAAAAQHLYGRNELCWPAPRTPTVYDDLDGKVENFRSRMQVMPGLTGYAQVNGGYDLNPAEKLKYDLIYINHCSVLFDLWVPAKKQYLLFLQ